MIEFLRLKYFLFFILSVFLLSGCVARPVEEVNAFEDAAKAIQEATDNIFIKYNDIVKEDFLSEYRDTSGLSDDELEVLYEFQMDDVYKFTTIADTENATKYRNSMMVVREYASLLVSLVNGEKASSSVEGLIDILENSDNEITGEGVPGFIKELQGVFGSVLSLSNIYKAKNIVEKGGPLVHDVINKMKSVVSNIFTIFTQSIIDSDEDAEEKMKLLEPYRVVFSNYVVLLEQLDETLRKLEKTFSEQNNEISVKRLILATYKLKGDIASFKRGIILLK